MSHGRYVTFQLAEGAVARDLFRRILRLIDAALRAGGDDAYNARAFPESLIHEFWSALADIDVAAQRSGTFWWCEYQSHLTDVSSQ